MKLGDVGNDIKLLQENLKKLGFFTGTIDSVFTSELQNAVCRIQQKVSLPTNGIVDHKTLTAINNLISKLPKPKSVTPNKTTPKYTVPKIKPAPRVVKGTKQLSKDDIKYIVIHHTAFKGDMTWDQIDKEHREKFDTDGFGYHFKISKDGTIQAGRPLNSSGGATIGVQCKGLNSISIGVVFDGNFEVEKLTSKQIESGKILAQWLKYVVYKGKIKFIGHKDAHAIDSDATITACPGKNFPLDMFKKL